MVDWRQAFDRQCPTLGVKSFVKQAEAKKQAGRSKESFVLASLKEFVKIGNFSFF
jgi:hypothetical protein